MPNSGGNLSFEICIPHCVRSVHGEAGGIEVHVLRDAFLAIDTDLRRVVPVCTPERGDKPELNDAARILEAEAARRESLFEQSVEAEKGRDDALTRRFEEALKKRATSR